MSGSGKPRRRQSKLKASTWRLLWQMALPTTSPNLLARACGGATMPGSSTPIWRNANHASR